MLLRIALASLLCGCQGESVVASTDAGPADTSAIDTSATDTSAIDAGELAAACTIKGNLLTNGDFAMGASGWKNNSFTFEPIAGPCGKALRLTSTAPYAGLGQDPSGVPLKMGTRFHLRAILHDKGRDSGQQPGVLVRFFHRNDAGVEVYTQTIDVRAVPTNTWHLAELAVPLERDEERLEMYVVSVSGANDTFDVGLVSLVVE